MLDLMWGCRICFKYVNLINGHSSVCDQLKKHAVFSLHPSEPQVFTGPATHDLLCDPTGTLTHLSEELLQQGGGPAVVEVPTFGRMADVCRVQQQGQGFGLVDAAKESRYIIFKSVRQRVSFICCDVS